jgi:hypothetical protein
MPATLASPRVRNWLHARCKSVGPAVFPDAVPKRHTTRAIVYRPVANTDLVNLAGTIMVRSLFDVFVSDTSDYAHDLQADADSLDAAILSGAMVVVSGRRIEAVRRVGEIDDQVEEEEAWWRRLGATYRIYTTTA